MGFLIFLIWCIVICFMVFYTPKKHKDEKRQRKCWEDFDDLD